MSTSIRRAWRLLNTLLVLALLLALAPPLHAAPQVRARKSITPHIDNFIRSTIEA